MASLTHNLMASSRARMECSKTHMANLPRSPTTPLSNSLSSSPLMLLYPPLVRCLQHEAHPSVSMSPPPLAGLPSQNCQLQKPLQDNSQGMGQESSCHRRCHHQSLLAASTKHCRRQRRTTWPPRMSPSSRTRLTMTRMTSPFHRFPLRRRVGKLHGQTVISPSDCHG